MIVYGSVVAIVLVYYIRKALIQLNLKYGLRHHGHDFLNLKLLGFGGFLFLLLFGGGILILAGHGSLDPSNGVALCAIALILPVKLFRYNIERTSFYVGMMGSLIQLPLFLLAGATCGALLLWMLMVGFASRPVYIIDN